MMEQELAMAMTGILSFGAGAGGGTEVPDDPPDSRRQSPMDNALTIRDLKPLWDMLRPRDGEGPGVRLDAVTKALENDDELLAAARAGLGAFVQHTHLVHSLAESGILPRRAFTTGLATRVGERALPRPRQHDDLRGALRLLLEPKDWEWVREAGVERWTRLVDLLVPEGGHVALQHDDIASAMRGLAQRIGALGIDEEINARVPEVEDYDSPFLDLTRRVHALVDHHRAGEGDEETWRELTRTMDSCRGIVERLDSGRQTWGTSINLTSMSRRLNQQFSRLGLLARLMRARDRDDYINALATLFVELVEAEQTSRDIMRYVRETVDLHIYQITEETAAKGEKYATSSTKGYWKFLLAALRGGAIVACFALVKLWLAHQHLPLGLEALAYSVNYALCFVLIYVSHSILATKQPAVTASALTRRLDQASDPNVGLAGVADMVVVVWRSQFVSFVGNLVAAFPLAALFIVVLSKFHIHIVDSEKSATLLASVHPVEGTLYYAGIAGVFLFASGVVAGMVQNRVTFTELATRLEAALARFGSRGKRIATSTTKHLGMVVGNVSLGFALGCAGPIGEALDISFDIRHIAFSSANVGVVTAADPELMVRSEMLWSLLGVLGIGLMNFLVSFGLTLAMTLESRKISLKQNSHLLCLLVQRALQSPLSWFFPTSGAKPPQGDDLGGFEAPRPIDVREKQPTKKRAKSEIATKQRAANSS